MIQYSPLIKAWLHFLSDNAGLSPRSIEEYSKDMTYFCQWSAQFATPLDILDCSLPILEGYVASMNERGLSVATIKRRVAAVRGFYRWAVVHGHCAVNPAAYLVTPRAAFRLVRPADEMAVRSFLASPPASPRVYMIQFAVSVMLATGMRLSEVLSLRGEDFDFELCLVRVIGKGNKERLCAFSPDASIRLAEFVGGSTGPLFDGVKESTLRWGIINHVRDGGRGVNPHAIRHLFASRCLAAGMSLKTLSVLMGHSSVKTTERYTTIAGHDLSMYASAACPRLS